jgi:hypothetical protein
MILKSDILAKDMETRKDLMIVHAHATGLRILCQTLPL